MPNFLIIRFSSLGDIVITTSVIRALRASYDDCRIYYLTKKQFEPVLDGLALDGVFTIDANQRSSFREILGSIRETDIDYIIDLHRNQRSFLFRLFLRKKTLKTKKRNLQRRLLVSSKEKKHSENSVLFDHLQALEPLGIAGSFLPELSVTSPGFGKEAGIDRDTVIIHPGAKWDLKKWGIDNYLELASHLSDYLPPVFIDDGGVLIPPNTDFPKIGGMDINQLKAVLCSCGLFIGNDSGPVHIAAALGTPSVAIFGPTHPSLGFTPHGKRTLVVQNNPGCSPCSLHGNGRCKLNNSYNAKCMFDLKPETVAKQVLKFMEIKR